MPDSLTQDQINTGLNAALSTTLNCVYIIATQLPAAMSLVPQLETAKKALQPVSDYLGYLGTEQVKAEQEKAAAAKAAEEAQMAQDKIDAQKWRDSQAGKAPPPPPAAAPASGARP